MNFFTGLFKAIGNCFKAFGVVFEKGLWPYLFYPLIIWILMWVASIWLFANLATYVADYLKEQMDINSIPDSGSWLSFAKPFLTGYFSLIIGWILKLVFWLVSSTFSKYMVLIFMSPIFSLLSESTEEKLTGTKFPFSGSQLVKDIFRGIGISLRNMFFEYLVIALCFSVTLFFAPLAIFTVPFLMFMSWYFTGFTMLDYNFERHKMGISQSVKFTRKYMGLACGIGLMYSVLMMLPFFVGLMFAPVIAVVGASISFIEIKQSSSTPPLQ